MTDKNGTTYLTKTGKEKQTTLGILGVITVIIIICFEAMNKETLKVSQFAYSTIKVLYHRQCQYTQANEYHFDGANSIETTNH